MTPKEFWLAVAGWGSYMSSGDPGACLYGFDERGAVASEEHRAVCIQHLDTTCREIAKRNDAEQDALVSPDEKEIDGLIAYLRTAPNLNPENLTRPRWVVRKSDPLAKTGDQGEFDARQYRK